MEQGKAANSVKAIESQVRVDILPAWKVARLAILPSVTCWRCLMALSSAVRLSGRDVCSPRWRASSSGASSARSSPSTQWRD